MQKRTALLGAIVIALSAFVVAQQKASPPANAQCKFSDGKTVTVDYSSPRMKGRQIYGGLVPFGQVWRTGANEATTFVTTADTNVGGKDVPAGNYTIFTVPNKDKWTLIVNKKTGEWGIPYKYDADELTRVNMDVSKTSGPVENFTISFHEMGNGCHMYLDWENTRATVLINEKK